MWPKIKVNYLLWVEHVVMVIQVTTAHIVIM